MIGELLSKYAEIRIVALYLQQEAVVASRSMKEYKVGQTIVVEMIGGRIVEATITAIIYRSHKRRLRVSFGNQTALIYEWQIVAPK